MLHPVTKVLATLIVVSLVASGVTASHAQRSTDRQPSRTSPTSSP